MCAVAPLEHECDNVWRAGLHCQYCPPQESRRTSLPAPNFHTMRLKAWNNMDGAGGVTGKEYVDKMMADAKASGKTEEQMPVSKNRWI